MSVTLEKWTLWNSGELTSSYWVSATSLIFFFCSFIFSLHHVYVLRDPQPWLNFLLLASLCRSGWINERCQLSVIIIMKWNIYCFILRFSTPDGCPWWSVNSMSLQFSRIIVSIPISVMQSSGWFLFFLYVWRFPNIFRSMYMNIITLI